MKYKQILKELALKENVSEKEIEREMKIAIEAAGLKCSVKEFIETTSNLLKQKTIYSI